MGLERAPRSRIYDGPFYARMVDPMLKGVHERLARHVEPGGRLLDIGAGTGALLLRLAPRAHEAVGIELSPMMQRYAQRQLRAAGLGNSRVVLGDAATVLAHEPDGSYDTATLVLVLHEMPHAVRQPLLREAARLARVVLCLDYSVPMPWNWAGLRNRGMELAAGMEHFSAFRDYSRRGGVCAIAAAAGLSCEQVRVTDAGALTLWAVRS